MRARISTSRAKEEEEESDLPPASSTSRGLTNGSTAGSPIAKRVRTSPPASFSDTTVPRAFTLCSALPQLFPFSSFAIVEAYCADDRPLGVPTLLVIGHEGAGKSRLLNSLLGRDIFPTATCNDDLGTLVAIEVQLRTSPQASCSLMRPRDTSAARSGLDQDVRRVLRQETIRMFKARSDNASGMTIQLRMTGPSLPNLNLVDLPGLPKSITLLPPTLHQDGPAKLIQSICQARKGSVIALGLTDTSSSSASLADARLQLWSFISALGLEQVAVEVLSVSSTASDAATPGPSPFHPHGSFEVAPDMLHATAQLVTRIAQMYVDQLVRVWCPDALRYFTKCEAHLVEQITQGGKVSHWALTSDLTAKFGLSSDYEDASLRLITADHLRSEWKNAGLSALKETVQTCWYTSKPATYSQNFQLLATILKACVSCKQFALAYDKPSGASFDIASQMQQHAAQFKPEATWRRYQKHLLSAFTAVSDLTISTFTASLETNPLFIDQANVRKVLISYVSKALNEMGTQQFDPVMEARVQQRLRAGYLLSSATVETFTKTDLDVAWNICTACLGTVLSQFSPDCSKCDIVTLTDRNDKLAKILQYREARLEIEKKRSRLCLTVKHEVGSGGLPQFAKPQNASPSVVTICLRDQAGDMMHFKVNWTTPFGKVYRAYAAKKGLCLSKFALIADSIRLRDTDTPSSLSLYDDACIDVVLSQSGC